MGSRLPDASAMADWRLGPFVISGRVCAAPMAGVADAPLRRLWRDWGAAYTVGEMTTAEPGLLASEKTRKRLRIDAEDALPVVQLAGADPGKLAAAARHAQSIGARVIDINMGCPAKKVCHVAAGSALLRDEALVRRILEAVVAAVEVPVTLKLRTGWSPEQRNALAICTMAQDIGVRLITLHGRTRACAFRGNAEYDTIAQVRAALRIPLIANGDIDSPEKAAAVLRFTGADAVMVGRAALRRPWIFSEIQAHLNGETQVLRPITELAPRLLRYLDEHHAHHGPTAGVRTARKRIFHLISGVKNGTAFCDKFMRLETAEQQRDALARFLDLCAARHPFFEYSQDPLEQADVHG